MFTGIIESLGEIIEITQQGTNLTFRVRSGISPELKIDQSLSHNGVCLTVVEVSDGTHCVTAIDETLRKTNLGQLRQGDLVNLERCMPANGRFDGHIVQGHVDQTGRCVAISDEQGSWLFDVEYEADSQHITVEKGSICLNGVSLTVFNTSQNSFRVAIIPYTYEHTTFHRLRVGDTVNLEFDVVGKYIRKMLEYRMIG
jgi:riboflavin synthase